MENEIEKVLENTKYNINDYNYVYNRLQDDTSKRVFYNRVMLDSTNDPFYSLSMIKESIESSSFDNEKDRMMYEHILFLLRNNNYSKKIYIVGFPNNYRIPLCDVWQSWNPLNVVCIFDEISREDEYVYDATGDKYVNVVSTNRINEYNYEDSIVIIANRKYEYLKNRFNVSDDKIFIFYDTAAYEKGIQYFGEPFVRLGDNEVFVDGGALDLDTSKLFSKWTYGNYKKIYAFEPMDKLYTICQKVLNNSKLRNVELYKLGLTDEKKKIRFVDKGSASRQSEDGSIIVDGDSIDNILNGDEATIIKLDIEGSEYDALKGAKETIKKYKPTLMICVYHKPNDVIELLKLVLSYNSDYKVYIRHYGYTMYETVAYFVN